MSDVITQVYTMHVTLPWKDRVGRELHSVLSRFLVWIDNAVIE